MCHTDNTIHEAHKNEIVRTASILTADSFRGFIGVLAMAALDPTTVSEARNANAVQSES